MRWPLVNCATAIALVLTCLGSAQQPLIQEQSTGGSLQDFLRTNADASPKTGALIAVDASREFPRFAESGVGAYGRQQVQCGGVAAIVPKTMVIYDGSAVKPSNLVDGLSREDKVRYFMSTLNPQQWSLATTKGIGVADTFGEQKDVIRAIIPAGMVLAYSRVAADGRTIIPLQERPVTDQELPQLRLFFHRVLRMDAPWGEEKKFVPVDARREDFYAAGSTIVEPRDVQDIDTGLLFGFQVRKIVPNYLKQSDLFYDATLFNAVTGLPKETTVAELLATISRIEGIALVPDARIANKPVTVLGDRARCGDILKAIALSVTGTFRKVGTVYVLTSDLEGLAARQLKVACFAEAAETSLAERRAQWDAQVWRSGGLNQIGYAPDDALAPKDSLRYWLASHRGSPAREAVSTQLLSPNWRAVLERDPKRGKPLAGPEDTVRLQEKIEWEFVLPDGQPIRWDRQFDPEEFSPRGFAPKPIPYPRRSPAVELGKEGAAAVILKYQDAQVGTDAVRQIRDYGFSEAWVQTDYSQTLTTSIAICKEAGMGVRLMVRPWELGRQYDPRFEERTLLGETFSAAYTRVVNPGEQRSPVASPLSPGLDAKWTSIRSMCQTQGLLGVVMTDSQPPGFEPSREERFDRALGAAALASVELGYTDAERQSFLASYSIDPVDLVQPFPTVPIDFTEPEFFDPQNPSLASTALDQWDRFRADLNASQTQRLLELMGVPVYVEPRKPYKHMPIESFTKVEPGFQVQTADASLGRRGRDSDDIPIYRMSPAMTAAQQTELSNILFEQAQRHRFFAVDLSNVPSYLLSQVLRTYFTTSKSPVLRPPVASPPHNPVLAPWAKPQQFPVPRKPGLPGFRRP